MVVVSVIIIGAAIATGMHMMATPERNTMKQHVIYDLQFFASQIQAYQRTPFSMGGALGRDGTKEDLGIYLGFDELSYTNENARYEIEEYKLEEVKINAVSYDGRLQVTMTVDLEKKSLEAISFEMTIVSD